MPSTARGGTYNDGKRVEAALGGVFLDVSKARPADPIRIKKGKPLPRHKNYVRDSLKWKFLEASYKGGHRYKDSCDAGGEAVLVQHEQEPLQAYNRRKRMSSYHNFCKPIVDKLTGFVFSSPIARDSDQRFSDWAEDVDNRGTCLNEYMRRVTMKAAIMDRWFIQVDTTKPEDGMTQAQVDAAGSRMFVRDLHPCRVINWRHDSGGEDEEGDGDQYLITDDGIGQHGGARLWDEENYQVVELDQEGLVAAIGPETPHEWPFCPIIKVKAHASHQSLVEDVAELSLSIFNMDSLLKEELVKRTFSQHFLFGANIKKEMLTAVDLGSRKVVIVPVDATTVKLEGIAADASQADSFRAQIEADVREIYRIVGLKPPDVEQGQAESGRALKIRFAETAWKAAELADMAEDAEEKIVELYNACYGQSVEEAEYPEDFDEDDLQVELKQTLDTISADLPITLKKAQVSLYVDKAFSKNLDEEELREIREEIEAKYVVQEVPGPAVPGTLPKGQPAMMSPEALKEMQEHPQLGAEGAKKVAEQHEA